MAYRCTTHHHACECREAATANAIEALRKAKAEAEAKTTKISMQLTQLVGEAASVIEEHIGNEAADRIYTRLAEIDQGAGDLLAAGVEMSNICFNLSQAHRELTERDREVMAECRLKWDNARRRQ